jgi:ribonucleoside-diphosphate reductase alpha chain
MQAYTEGWKLGLKALAVYRDGSKRTQPLNAGRDVEKTVQGEVVELDQYRPRRRKLPDERVASTHKFSIAGHEGYLTVGLYEDGNPGEIFLKMAKEGSTVSGLMDTIATMTSISLQYGVPLKALVDKFSHTRFEPSGFTNNKQIPIAKSVMDYVFRHLGNRFLETEEAAVGGEPTVGDGGAVPISIVSAEPSVTPLAAGGAVAGGAGDATSAAMGSGPQSSFVNQADAPSCMDCGSIMIRNGACYKCPNCGSTSGCS